MSNAIIYPHQGLVLLQARSATDPRRTRLASLRQFFTAYGRRMLAEDAIEVPRGTIWLCPLHNERDQPSSQFRWWFPKSSWAVTS